MANTYSRLYVHIIFAVKGRENLISEKWSEDLYKYISGIITNKNQKLMIINGMPDHIHILLGFNPDSVISDIVRDINQILPDGSTITDLFMVNLNGKMDLVPFR